MHTMPRPKSIALFRPGIATAVLLLSLSGCGGSGGGTSTDVPSDTVANPQPAAIEIALDASPATVTSGDTVVVTWTTRNATRCSASGAWSGDRNLSGSEISAALVAANNTFTLNCTGPAGTTSRSVTVTTSAPAPAVEITLTATPATVNNGETTRLDWSTLNADRCTAAGAWSGDKGLSGSETSAALVNPTNTFTLDCSGPGGTASRSVTVSVNSSGIITGLDFPGSAGTVNTMRFKFTNPLPAYPATYIWRAYPRQQSGYYTAFFWGNDDGAGQLSTFLWTSTGGADMYYGAHPYPDNPPNGNTHQWEISVEQQDFVNGAVVYDRWYTQALVVWADSGGIKHHVFYWDLPNTDSAHRVERVSTQGWGDAMPPAPALTWGDAPWNPGKEVWDGVLRGIQVYATNLSLSDILMEAATPGSTPGGAASLWYLNLDPKPDDIADRSGNGNNPAWVGNERPALWTGP